MGSSPISPTKINSKVIMKEGITKRQEANLKIANTLKGTAWHQLAIQLEALAKEFPQQRTGQIICNYICPDYRDSISSVATQALMGFLFPEDPDPFFEESTTTLNRLLSYFKNEKL